MKKSKALNIKFEPWKEFKSRTTRELEKVIKSRKKSIQPKNLILFDSVVSYQRLMSEQKYILLAAIRNFKPNSLYQLAKLVDRDFPNVKKDCEILESSGFIVLQESGDKRKTKVPKLKFDYNVIKIHLPNMVYSHFLDNEAA